MASSSLRRRLTGALRCGCTATLLAHWAATKKSRSACGGTFSISARLLDGDGGSAAFHPFHRRAEAKHCSGVYSRALRRRSAALQLVTAHSNAASAAALLRFVLWRLEQKVIHQLGNVQRRLCAVEVGLLLVGTVGHKVIAAVLVLLRCREK